MISEEHLYAIALRECSLVGDINFIKLIRAFGSAKNVWENAKKEFRNTNGLGRKIIADIGNPKHLRFAEKELSFCEAHNIRIRLRQFNELPFLLNECDDAPAILYQKGGFADSPIPLSIVGTRNMTHYGKQFIKEFFEETSSYNYISVSGLAIGTDTEVHHQSLHHNIPTAAVLAHGFHTLYPAKNKILSEKILQEGGVLFTEFNSSRKPDRENFIQRNRIIAGISPATIVVETAFGGGSISTATFANNYNRDVFALPGKITDQYSKGCNQLIFLNKASVISSVKNLIFCLGFTKPKQKMEELFPVPEDTPQLTEYQNLIYKYITENPQINLDDLGEKMACPTYKISPVILELELLGMIKTLSGRQFIAI